MSLAEYVRILGRGPGRARSLTQDEAYRAMTLMLSGEGPPEAVGAILMLMRMKGETASEIAGFAKAAQDALPAGPAADLDWPCYAAGRTRGAPWFLHAAKAIAQNETRVLLHGWNKPDARVRAGLDVLSIPFCTTLDDAASALDHGQIAYLPLEIIHPRLFALLNLRDAFGLRSCVNTVCRMLNPGRAVASVQGVFHPSYRLLQADAAQLLGWEALTVIKGGGGEFERHPGKTVEAFGLRQGRPWQGSVPPLVNETARLQDYDGPLVPVDAPFAQAMVAGTIDLARDTLAGACPSGRLKDSA